MKEKEDRMTYFSSSELGHLLRLRRELASAEAHSRQAVKLGRQIAEIYRQADLRQPRSQAMDRLSKRIMDSLP